MLSHSAERAAEIGLVPRIIRMNRGMEEESEPLNSEGARACKANVGSMRAVRWCFPHEEPRAKARMCLTRCGWNFLSEQQRQTRR